MRRSKVIALLLGITFLLLSPAIANAEEYGMFFPDTGPDGIGYQADITPFNNGDSAEMINFTCVLPNGQPLGDREQELLGDIMRTGAKIYANQLDLGDFRDSKISSTTGEDESLFEDVAERVPGVNVGAGAVDLINGSETGPDLPHGYDLEGWKEDFDNDEKYQNLGYDSGVDGMQTYIRQIKTVLIKGEWARSDDTKVRHPDSSHEPTWVAPGSGLVFDTGDDEKMMLSKKDQALLAKMLNEDATTPVGIIKIGKGGIPAGCPFKPFASPDNIDLKDLVSNFGDTFALLIPNLLLKIVDGVYSKVQPVAFKFTFWTPHSERGDLLWDISETCNPGNQDDISTTGVAPNTSSIKTSCEKGVPLGYNKKNLHLEKQAQDNGWFLKVAAFLKWLVSGTYFLLIFVAAGLYMIRGDAVQNLNLMKLIPRLLLSIVLTLMTPFLMGAVITMANTLVMAIFGQDDAAAVGTVNLVFGQSGIVIGGSEFFQRFAQAIIGGFASFCMVMLIITAVMRQVVLVALVVTAPLAVFCLINPAWKNNFMKWLKAFLAVCFIPLIMALLLKVSMLVNPLIIAPSNAYGTATGLLGLILLCGTLYAMVKLAKSAKDFAMGQSDTATGAASGAASGIASVTQGTRLEGVGARAAGRLGASASSAQTAAAGGAMGGMIGGAVPSAMGGSKPSLPPGTHEATQRRKDEKKRKRQLKKGRVTTDEKTFNKDRIAMDAIVARGGDPRQELGYVPVEKGGRFYRDYGNSNSGKGKSNTNETKRKSWVRSKVSSWKTRNAPTPGQPSASSPSPPPG